MNKKSIENANFLGYLKCHTIKCARSNQFLNWFRIRIRGQSSRLFKHCTWRCCIHLELWGNWGSYATSKYPVPLACAEVLHVLNAGATSWGRKFTPTPRTNKTYTASILFMLWIRMLGTELRIENCREIYSTACVYCSILRAWRKWKSQANASAQHTNCASLHAPACNTNARMWVWDACKLRKISQPELVNCVYWDKSASSKTKILDF